MSNLRQSICPDDMWAALESPHHATVSVYDDGDMYSDWSDSSREECRQEGGGLPPKPRARRRKLRNNARHRLAPNLDDVVVGMGLATRLSRAASPSVPLGAGIGRLDELVGEGRLDELVGQGLVPGRGNAGENRDSSLRTDDVSICGRGFKRKAPPSPEERPVPDRQSPNLHPNPNTIPPESADSISSRAQAEENARWGCNSDSPPKVVFARQGAWPNLNPNPSPNTIRPENARNSDSPPKVVFARRGAWQPVPPTRDPNPNPNPNPNTTRDPVDRLAEVLGMSRQRENNTPSIDNRGFSLKWGAPVNARKSVSVEDITEIFDGEVASRLRQLKVKAAEMRAAVEGKADEPTGLADLCARVMAGCAQVRKNATCEKFEPGADTESTAQTYNSPLLERGEADKKLDPPPKLDLREALGRNDPTNRDQSAASPIGPANSDPLAAGVARRAKQKSAVLTCAAFDWAEEMRALGVSRSLARQCSRAPHAAPGKAFPKRLCKPEPSIPARTTEVDFSCLPQSRPARTQMTCTPGGSAGQGSGRDERVRPPAGISQNRETPILRESDILGDAVLDAMGEVSVINREIERAGRASTPTRTAPVRSNDAPARTAYRRSDAPSIQRQLSQHALFRWIPNEDELMHLERSRLEDRQQRATDLHHLRTTARTRLDTPRDLMSLVRSEEPASKKITVLRCALSSLRTTTKATGECAICLDTMKHTRATALPCLHVFHMECISMWVVKNTGREAKCPLCKAVIIE